MEKKLVCPVCKKEFEKTTNKGYAINGVLTCSFDCFLRGVCNSRNEDLELTVGKKQLDEAEVTVEQKIETVSTKETTTVHVDNEVVAENKTDVPKVDSKPSPKTTQKTSTTTKPKTTTKTTTSKPKTVTVDDVVEKSE